MNRFESGEKPERDILEKRIKRVVDKMRAEGYEFDTEESESEFFLKLEEKDIGFTKIPGVDTEDGYVSLDKMIEVAITENAPRRGKLPKATDGEIEKG